MKLSRASKKHLLGKIAALEKDNDELHAIALQHAHELVVVEEMIDLIAEKLGVNISRGTLADPPCIIEGGVV